MVRQAPPTGVLIGWCVVWATAAQAQTPAEMLCRGLPAAVLETCRQVCAELPADEPCHLVRHYGRAPLAMVDAANAGGDLAQAGRKAGLSDEQVSDLLAVMRFVQILPPAVPFGFPPGQEKTAQAFMAAYQQAVQAMQARDYAAAIPPSREALRLVGQARGADSVIAALQTNLAHALDAVGQSDDARKAFDQAMEDVTQRLGTRHPYTLATGARLGQWLAIWGYYEAAHIVCARMAPLHAAVFGPDHPRTADAFYWLGFTEKHLSNYPAARQGLTRALAARELTLGPNHAQTGAVRLTLAELEHTLGHFDAVLPLARRALEVALKSGTLAGVVNARSVLVEALGSKGRLDEALAEGERLVGEAEQLDTGDRIRRAYAYSSRGFARFRARQPERAVEDFKTALRFATEHDRLALGIKKRLGDALLSAGRLTEARALLQATVDGLGDGDAPWGLLASLGTCMMELGDFEAGIRYLETDLAMTRKRLSPDHPRVGLLLLRLGAALNRMSRGDESLAAFREAQPIFAKHYSEDSDIRNLAMADLGVALAFAGQVETARRHLETALRHLESRAPDQAMVIAYNLGFIHRLEGKLDVAERSYATLLTKAEARWGPLDERTWFVREALAEVRTLTGSRKALAAVEPLIDALPRWETDALDNAGDGRQLFRVAATRRQLGYSSLLHLTRSSPKKTLAVLARWQGMASRLERVHLGRAPRQRVNPRDICKRLGKRTMVAYAQFKVPTRAMQYPMTQLKQGDDHLAAVVVKPGCKVDRLELGPLAPVQRAVENYRRGILEAERCYIDSVEADECEDEFEDLDRRGAVLRAAIWDPVAATLGTQTDIVLVTDGILRQVSFDALPGTTPGSYLVETYRMAQMPYPAAVLHQRSPPAGEALIVGDVSYEQAAPSRSAATAKWERCGPAGCKTAAPVAIAQVRAGNDVECAYGTRWTSLGETEARSVATSLAKHGVATTLVTGPNARADAVGAAMTRSRIIHLATHGFFASSDKCAAVATTQSPLPGLSRGSALRTLDPRKLSAVVLAGANQPDTHGLLSARDVLSLDLGRTELAVLSACETGLEKTVVGEGPTGLGGAFLAAGAQHVVVSLWRVPSEPTTQLAESLYRHLPERKGPRRSIAAFRQARLDLIEYWREQGVPHSAWLWGAFTLLTQGE